MGDVKLSVIAELFWSVQTVFRTPCVQDLCIPLNTRRVDADTAPLTGAAGARIGLTLSILIAVGLYASEDSKSDNARAKMRAIGESVR